MRAQEFAPPPPFSNNLHETVRIVILLNVFKTVLLNSIFYIFLKLNMNIIVPVPLKKKQYYLTLTMYPASLFGNIRKI